jgi:[ribosomal protein S18]-alanine N-acetyltransferase
MPLPPGVRVRDMNEGDLDEVLALEKQTFPSPWTEDLFLQELRKGHNVMYLVAVMGGTLLGYIGAHQFKSEIHVTNMAVDREFRRRGLGSLLLITCVRRGYDRGARWLTLEVRENNTEAQQFYRRFGFEEIGLRYGYYSETGENAVLMVTGDIYAEEYRRLIDTIESEITLSGGNH